MTFVRGLAAGTAGALALVGLDRLEAALLGRPAVYAPGRIAERLARRLAHVRLSRRAARAVGTAMRAGYGSALGVVYAASPRRVRRPWAFGSALALAEWWALPAVGATPPARRWRTLERMLLVAHALAFTSAAEMALAGLRRAQAAAPIPG